VQYEKYITGRAAEHPSQMVLIHPIINEEQQTLDIAFPEGSDCRSFSVPLCPDAEQLSGWRR